MKLGIETSAADDKNADKYALLDVADEFLKPEQLK
jgi:hypothetical protein